MQMASPSGSDGSSPSLPFRSATAQITTSRAFDAPSIPAADATMHYQSDRQLQARATSLSVTDVLTRAAHFFARQSGVYSAFVERQGPNHVVLRGQGGEEVAIAAHPDGDATMVTGGTYLFDAQVARFLDSLPLAAAPAGMAIGASVAGESVVGESAPGPAATSPAAPALAAPAPAAPAPTAAP